MKIYTGKGDSGSTSLFGGSHVSKSDIRIEAYGTVDELNSVIGVCRSFNTAREVDEILAEIQTDLFTLGADLATPSNIVSSAIQRINASDSHRLEQHIDEIDRHLEPLRNFILPGGNKSAAFVHFARTVCRRAERHVVRLSLSESIGSDSIVYLNRLSDLLFVLARWINVLSSTPETPWSSAQRRENSPAS